MPPVLAYEMACAIYDSIYRKTGVSEAAKTFQPIMVEEGHFGTLQIMQNALLKPGLKPEVKTAIRTFLNDNFARIVEDSGIAEAQDVPTEEPAPVAGESAAPAPTAKSPDAKAKPTGEAERLRLEALAQTGSETFTEAGMCSHTLAVLKPFFDPIGVSGLVSVRNLRDFYGNLRKKGSLSEVVDAIIAGRTQKRSEAASALAASDRPSDLERPLTVGDLTDPPWLVLIVFLAGRTLTRLGRRWTGRTHLRD